MKQQRSMMIALQWILGLFLLISISYFIIGEMNSEREDYFKVGNGVTYNEGWEKVLGDGSRVKISIPGDCNVKKGETLAIEKQIPEEFSGTWLCIRSSQQDIKISVDGEVRKDYSTKGTRSFGKNSVSVYVFAQLFPEDAGKTIRIEIVSNSPYSGYVNDILEGDREQIWTGLVKRHLPITIMALFMLVLSVLLVCYSIIIRVAYKKNMDIFYLGIGLVVASVWIIAESKLRQIFLPNSTIAGDVGFMMVMLLPFPFIAYINKIQKYRYEKWYIGISIGVVINFLISTALQFLNIMDFSETMGLSHTILLILIILMFVTVMLDIKKSYVKDYREVALGMAGLMLAGVYEIYLVYDKSAINNTMGLCIGLIFLFFMAVIKTGRDLLDLEKEKQIAVAASQSKTMFLANMSHEIRTPINTIVGMNEMILRENHNNETREYAKNIEHATRMLMGLIDDILDFSKLEAGKLDINEGTYKLAPMLNDVILGVSMRLNGRDLAVNLDIDEGLPSVLSGDELRIKQIMNNLLSNAVKYTEQGNVTIKIKGLYEGDKFILQISVADTGIGIRSEDMETLFDSFQRMELKRNRYIQGTGLGLAITKQLVDRMNGTISVDSEYGKGSCFTVNIPQTIIDKSPMGDLPTAYAKEVYNEETVDNTAGEKNISLHDIKAKVLVVDDNDMNLMVIKTLLSKTGLELDLAGSGMECLELCKKKKYDLILMDHMMPELDGIETLEKLRQDEESLNNQVNAIVLTANAISGAREQYEKAGFADYLSKPVEYKLLEETLLKYLAG